MSDRAILLTITTAGMAALFSAASDGVRLRLTHLAIGSAGGAGYAPTGAETALRGEFARVAIGGGDYLGDFEIMVQALFDGQQQGWVNELGVWAEPEAPGGSPILFALWSMAGAPLAYKTAGVPLALAATLALSQVPPDAIELVVGAPSVNISIAGPFAALSAELIRLQRRVIESEIARLTPVIQSNHGP